MKDLKKRTITAIVLIIILIPVVYFGGVYMDIFAGLMCFGAAFELERMYKQGRNWDAYGFIDILLSISNYAFILLYSYSLINAYALILVLLMSVFLIEGFLMIFTKNSNIHTLGNSLITIFYPSIGFSSLSVIRNYSTVDNKGLFLLIFVVHVCMMTDMFAYFVGCKFGKHKLSIISPKKSWEGSIGGTTFGVIVPTIFACLTGIDKYIFYMIDSRFVQILLIIFVSLILSVIDEIGDLFASKLKRFYGIKDYSQLFPGHGGVLDRFDSYIYAATALLMLLMILEV